MIDPQTAKVPIFTDDTFWFLYLELGMNKRMNPPIPKTEPLTNCSTRHIHYKIIIFCFQLKYMHLVSQHIEEKQELTLN